MNMWRVESIVPNKLFPTAPKLIVPFINTKYAGIELINYNQHVSTRNTR